MAGLARARPQPLVTPRVFTSTRTKYSRIRMKEALSNALGGNRGSGLFATAAGQSHFGTMLDTNVRSMPMSGGLGSAVLPDSAGTGFGDGMNPSRRSSVALSAGGQRQNIAAGLTGSVAAAAAAAAAARKPSLSAQSVPSAT
jgi:SAGA-associated factor 73